MFQFRTLAVLAPLAVLAASPALAREAPRDTGLAEIEARLSDPRSQDAMGQALAGMMAALLQIKAEPFARAMEKVGDGRSARAIPKGATLGDLAGPQARHMPSEVARKVPAMMGAMGAMAGAFEEMLPQLEAMGRQMEGAVENARLPGESAPSN